MLEDDERALDAVVHVDRLERTFVEVGVVLHGRHQLGDAAGRRADLADEILDVDACGQPPDGVGGHIARVRQDPLEPRFVQPGRSQHRRQLPRIGDARVLQAAGECVLQVAGVERRERGRRLRSLHRLGRKGQELLEAFAIEGSGHLDDCAARFREPGAQRFGGPTLGRRRVVQLVGQARGESTEGDQLFSLADDRLGRRQAEEHPAEKVYRHREPCGEDMGEVLGPQLEQP